MSGSPRPRAVVVGAGVFGSWTAEHLRRAGWRVLLVDRMGAANALASSGGESRLTRANYGPDEIYTRMAVSSLTEWKRLSDASALPLFHPHGVLFFSSASSWITPRACIDVHERLNLPDRGLGSRRARRTLAADRFHRHRDWAVRGRARRTDGAARRAGIGARFRRARRRIHGSRWPSPASTGHEVLLNGEPASCDAVVYACGPWLGKVFPDTLGDRIFVTRQEIAFIAPPDGDLRFEPNALPGWADFNGGDMYYGLPNVESRGFKIAHDAHGPAFDPDSGDRRMSEEGMTALRAFVERRFPSPAARPFTEFRVCQYENSSNGDFLIDRHPTLEGAYLLGGGSGHGFKHGPEVGRAMAELVVNGTAPDARFSLATKGAIHSRTVV